jgi:hypothetical protein
MWDELQIASAAFNAICRTVTGVSSTQAPLETLDVDVGLGVKLISTRTSDK